MTIAAILDAERDRLGWTIYRLAKSAEMPANTVTRILDGTTIDPAIGRVIALVNAMGRTLTWLDRKMNPTKEAQT